MKNSILLTARRAAQMGIALAVVTTLTSCASADSSSRVLETRSSAHGEIASLRSFQSGSTLYVTGSLQRSPGYAIPRKAHVDIELIDRSGRVIASQKDRIESVHPKHDNRRGGRYSFAASFPIEVARGSDRIRVIYHVDSHP